MTDELQLFCGAVQLADGSPFVNDADGGLGVVEEIQPDGKKDLEIVGLIDAEAPTVFDRVTLTKTFLFRVARELANLAAAVDFYVMHDQEIPARADLAIQLLLDDVTYTWRASGCGWESITHKPTGVFVVTEYRVTLGALLTREVSDPDAAQDAIDAGKYADGYGAQAVGDGGHDLDLPEPATVNFVDAGTYA